MVTLQNLMEARSHCDTVGPPGIKETIVTQVKHMKPRSHCDTLGFFPSALQLAVPAHCIMCPLHHVPTAVLRALPAHKPRRSFPVCKERMEKPEQVSVTTNPHAQYKLPGMLSPFYKGHCEQE